MQITKIELQKKGRKRYNLYDGSEFLFAVSEDTLVHFHISRDKEYPQALLSQIEQYEAVNGCVEQALRYLTRRPHLRRELQRKLKQKNYSEIIIEEAMVRLEKLNYLDDVDFIKRFITDQVRIRRNGPMVIRRKLREKGAPPAEVDHWLYELYPDNLQMDNARVLYEKKKAKLETDSKEVIFRHLQQKGYNWDIISALREAEKDEAPA